MWTSMRSHEHSEKVWVHMGTCAKHVFLICLVLFRISHVALCGKPHNHIFQIHTQNMCKTCFTCDSSRNHVIWAWFKKKSLNPHGKRVSHVNASCFAHVIPSGEHTNVLKMIQNHRKCAKRTSCDVQDTVIVSNQYFYISFLLWRFITL